MKNLKQIPKFKNEDQERNFWANHDSTQYIDWSKAKKVNFPNLKPTTRFNLKTIMKNFLFILAIGTSLFLLFFFITCTWIGFEVKSLCQDATTSYGGTCVDSLIMSLQDNTNSFKSRNDAIWALGQIGDPKALPVLQSFYTGNIPDREPYNGTISQYELKKAINLTSGGTNISALIWRCLFPHPVKGGVRGGFCY